MPAAPSDPYRFGDLLALARLSWTREMAARLAERGYADYRRSDATVLRLLQQGPVPIGQTGAALGVTRQAARKVADGLEQRGYALTERDRRDSRLLNVVLTPAGETYARAVVEVIDSLNRRLRQQVDPEWLAAADAVLRASIADAGIRDLAASLVPPPR